MTSLGNAEPSAPLYWSSDLLLLRAEAEPLQLRKKKTLKEMSLEERWEYFSQLSINPGEDDDVSFRLFSPEMIRKSSLTPSLLFYCSTILL